MTSFVYNDHLPIPNAPRVIQLTITECTDHTLIWQYSEKHLIVGKSEAEIIIQLVNKTLAKSVITTFASSGVTENHVPIKAQSFHVPEDGQSASFPVSLLPNQLVNFGVFVHLVWASGAEMTLFCDPQASNDPIKTV